MKPLVIFELANNHMGSISHARLIIQKYYELSKKFKNKIDFAIKFQYRDSKTFIHKTFYDSNDKHVLRFKSTFLSREQWKNIIKFSKNKFKLICTPFDEISVTNVVKDKFDFLKIASCSATDWPLVEFIAKKASNKKMICSLGGLTADEISRVISFFSNKKINIKFLYCVAKYPTSAKELNLKYFNELHELYPNKVEGISLHEDPGESLSGAIGYAMGSNIFEKHIGISKGSIKLNKYSVGLNQMNSWLENLNNSIDQVGSIKNRDKNILIEKEQLKGFQRGVYLKENKTKEKGEQLKFSDVSFNFPAQKGQLRANNFSKFTDFTTKRKIKSGEKILAKDLNISNERRKVIEIRDKIRELTSRAKLIVPKFSRIEISHHYGFKSFYKFGLCMITVVNKSYCKKYLFMFKNQVHPAQYHKQKEETFIILFGKIFLKITYKGKIIKKIMNPGDTFTIKTGMIHEFTTLSPHGGVIEEISSESIKTDSYYIDKTISKNKNRKTFVSFY